MHTHIDDVLVASCSLNQYSSKLDKFCFEKYDVAINIVANISLFLYFILMLFFTKKEKKLGTCNFFDSWEVIRIARGLPQIYNVDRKIRRGRDLLID